MNVAASAHQSAERLPPQALDVERSVLGSMLIDNSAVETAMENLTEECFYSGPNRLLFRCMFEMYEKKIPLDVLTLTEELKKKEWLASVGAEGYLSELAESVATSANIEYYAHILNEKSTLRQLISTAADITTDCFNAEGEPQNILDQAEAKIFGITQSRIKNSFESVGKLLPKTFEQIASYSKGGVQGVPTGFKALDEMTTGLQNSDLVIIAGRPSMGKTAFALSAALHAAVTAKFCTAIFSLEMSKAQIVQRMLCSEARVNMHQLRSGTLPKRDFPKLSIAAGPLAEAPLYIDDTPAITVLELRAKARRLKAQNNLGLIIIDYLQLMGSNGKVENRQQEISTISRQLKALAKELNVPVVALSQLSRAVEQRSGDHRPQLSDLRESGAIEQDADVVMFVFREEVYVKDDESKKGIAEIIIGKQRNGPIGDVKLAFVHDFARFENLSTMPEDSGGF